MADLLQTKVKLEMTLEEWAVVSGAVKFLLKKKMLAEEDRVVAMRVLAHNAHPKPIEKEEHELSDGA